MAEKTALPQINYLSDNPEQDWERFQGAMKHILTVPKGSQCDDESQNTVTPKTGETTQSLQKGG